MVAKMNKLHGWLGIEAVYQKKNIYRTATVYYSCLKESFPKMVTNDVICTITAQTAALDMFLVHLIFEAGISGVLLLSVLSNTEHQSHHGKILVKIRTPK